MTIAKALRHAFRPALDTGEFDDLTEALDRNKKAVSKAVEKEKEVDSLLCINCGPNRVRLRQLKARQRVARASA